MIPFLDHWVLQNDFFLFILGPAEYIFLQKCILSENNLNSKIIIISSKLLRLELNFAPLLLHTTMPWWHKCRTNGKCLLNAHNRKLVWGSTVKSSATLSGSKLFSDIYTKSHRIFGRVVWTQVHEIQSIIIRKSNIDLKFPALSGG